jgi:2-dehydropantoate 2-reductase
MPANVHNARMHHAILGPGGVGGLIAGCLSKTGEKVTMVVRPETLEQYPRQLTIESRIENFTVPVEKAVQVPSCDVVWFTVKTTQMESALRSFSPTTSVKGIVPLQNGIDHVAFLRERYGSEKVLPGVFAGETERVAPGHIVHRTPFARLNLIAKARPLLGKTLDTFLKMGFTGEFIEDEATLLWTKLVFLAPVALTTSAADLPIGGIISSAEWRSRLETCVRESCAVAKAEGAKVDPEAGIPLLLNLPPGMKSSMQKDLEHGNSTELDAIGGRILRGGARCGIPVPATQLLVEMVAKRAHQPV